MPANSGFVPLLIHGFLDQGAAWAPFIDKSARTPPSWGERAPFGGVSSKKGRTAATRDN
jgi:hypothetical protein